MITVSCSIVCISFSTLKSSKKQNNITFDINFSSLLGSLLIPLPHDRTGEHSCRKSSQVSPPPLCSYFFLWHQPATSPEYVFIYLANQVSRRIKSLRCFPVCTISYVSLVFITRISSFFFVLLLLLLCIIIISRPTPHLIHCRPPERQVHLFRKQKLSLTPIKLKWLVCILLFKHIVPLHPRLRFSRFVCPPSSLEMFVEWMFGYDDSSEILLRLSSWLAGDWYRSSIFPWPRVNCPDPRQTISIPPIQPKVSSITATTSPPPSPHCRPGQQRHPVR